MYLYSLFNFNIYNFDHVLGFSSASFNNFLKPNVDQIIIFDLNKINTRIVLLGSRESSNYSVI